MSSRSLAAARARRAGEQAPPVSGNRPITSIASHSAFAGMPSGVRTNPPMKGSGPNGMPPGMYPQQQGYGMPPPQQLQQQQQQPQFQQNPYANNAAAARGPPPQQPMYDNPYAQQQGGYPPYGMQPPPQQQQPHGGGFQPALTAANAPKGKISISDAIGLTTIRLGKVEQWILDNEPRLMEVEDRVLQGNVPEGGNPGVRTLGSNGGAGQALEEVFQRLQQLEQNAGGDNVRAEINQLADKVSKAAIDVSKMSEKMLRAERMATETKDLLKTFMIKYDAFVEETNNKFVDFEAALGELEKGSMEASNVVSADVVEDSASELGSLQGTSLTDLTGEITI